MVPFADYQETKVPHNFEINYRHSNKISNIDRNFVALKDLLKYQVIAQLIVLWNKEKKLDALGLSVRGESYGPLKTKQYIICRKLIKSTLRFWGTKRLFHPNFDQNSIISYISNRRRFCDLFEPKERPK